jgi:U1 small nuclear ribonucleoprotein C
MPKYYCNYCDIFLTHDAPRVIKDHNAGWKHGARVREHYLSRNLENMARNVGEVIRDYEERKELVPVPAPISSKKPPMPGFMPPSGQIPFPRVSSLHPLSPPQSLINPQYAKK